MPPQTNGSISIIVWSLIAVVAILIGLVVVTWLRKRLYEPDDEPASAGFTLSDLRQLHREGKISPEEFERAKAKMTASLMRAQKPKKPA